jgi:dephospho-CoA kinase
MRIIGLTGGIAAGKSQVSRILSELGAIIIDADVIAREIVEKGTSTWEEIRDEFGEEYFLADGSLNRKKLGKLVFSDKHALRKLNDITHPAIRNSIISRLDELKTQDYKGVVVVDAALLLEVGWDDLVDEVWVVDAPLEIRITRLMDRDGLSREEALNRINSQMTQEEKNEKADKIIKNESNMDNLEKEQEDFENIEEYFHSLTLLQKRELLEKIYSKIVIDTISNAKFGPKRLRLKEVIYNQYSSVYGLCKILGVQDFHEFNEYLKTKGRQELNLLERYFGDAEEYIAETQKHNHSVKFKQYFEEMDAAIDKFNDEFIEQFIDESFEKTGQVSEKTLDEVMQDVDKTYEEFKFKYFLKKILQNKNALT